MTVAPPKERLPPRLDAVKGALEHAMRGSTAARHAVHKLCEIAEKSCSDRAAHTSQNFSILFSVGVPAGVVGTIRKACTSCGHMVLVLMTR